MWYPLTRIALVVGRGLRNKFTCGFTHYRPQGKVTFLHLSDCSQGGSAFLQWTETPPDETPLGRDPWRETPSKSETPLALLEEDPPEGDPQWKTHLKEHGTRQEMTPDIK